MSHSYWKRRKQKLMERSRKGVEARALQREMRAALAQWVGTVTFDGPAFRGQHVVRLAQRAGEAGLLVDIDGFHHRPRTLRGLIRLVCRRMWQC